ncbi:PQQ-dependent catabolism-associated CXXCW motif protein [Pseudomonas sp. NFIX10]|uniref:PQQ-dependent catabolism-associated CXXCW motif protein n=1 Tax=unclassified Pseudomonas TaxID=196821 RepID=UPI0008EA6846|nr:MULTISPECIES: PQQ-dependent catabolism-associated CXXCW motif protein [unclassified Pseudomonas]SFA94207.1 PQQ-dependent catabolism-associated CXXCW motif protein [Pseudomonas sp. NFIX10]SFE41964.1 PQQ-dependent catabolism-associated CXXCW motif protein [Pseudomonas sp. NFACC06-1]
MPRLLAILLLGLALNVAQAETALFSAQGYRIAQYRSPTPATVDGAQTLDTQALQRLLGQASPPLLIDVYRRPWVQGQFIDNEAHVNLPGSLWLANTGDGDLSPTWQDYFAYHLRKATAGQTDRPLVFYCRSDCWLSWNAVKRAAAMGYKQVYWYRDGLDAWEAANLPLQAAHPEPFP